MEVEVREKLMLNEALKSWSVKGDSGFCGKIIYNSSWKKFKPFFAEVNAEWKTFLTMDEAVEWIRERL